MLLASIILELLIIILNIFANYDVTDCGAVQMCPSRQESRARVPTRQGIHRARNCLVLNRDLCPALSRDPCPVLSLTASTATGHVTASTVAALQNDHVTAENDEIARDLDRASGWMNAQLNELILSESQ